MNTTTISSDIPEGKAKRVLVVEDSPLNQEVALKQLENLGYQADAVSDGDQAIEALARKPYDIVLMDCQMPERNGYDTTMQIRINEQAQTQAGAPAKRVFIIAMTAYTDPETRGRCAAAGMDDFINKPVLLPELDVALRRASADRASTQAADQVIDPVVIAGLRQLRSPEKPGALAQLIDLFLREAPSQLKAMTEAVSRNDATSLSRAVSAASALKGSAANIGARRLAALCDEAEHTATRWMLAEAEPIVQRACAEFGRVRVALEYLRSADSPRG